MESGQEYLLNIIEIFIPMFFVEEVPECLGVDRTANPLFGDKTGSNLQFMINMTEWPRIEPREIFLRDHVN